MNNVDFSYCMAKKETGFSNFDGLSRRFVRFSLKTREINMKLAGLVARILESSRIA